MYPLLHKAGVGPLQGECNIRVGHVHPRPTEVMLPMHYRHTFLCTNSVRATVASHTASHRDALWEEDVPRLPALYDSMGLLRRGPRMRDREVIRRRDRWTGDHSP